MQQQARNYLCTSYQNEQPCLNDFKGCRYIKGQKETCPSTGNQHWQFALNFERSARKSTLCRRHPEITFRNNGRGDDSFWTLREMCNYVSKSESAIENTQFEEGDYPYHTNEKLDWEDIWSKATSNDISNIPANIRVGHYRTLKQIAKDNITPKEVPDKQVYIFWGPPGTGKSFQAAKKMKEEFGLENDQVYKKSGRNKWWDGYDPEIHIGVIIEEAGGAQSIHQDHLKVWFDTYSCIVENKGGAVAMNSKYIICTSNHDPDFWFAEESENEAVLDRVKEIVHFVGKSKRKGPVRKTFLE